MPLAPEPETGLFIRDDDEGLFSRDIDGQLVRLDAPAESDYGKTVTLQIDGQAVTVPLAEPLGDANGNIVLDGEGRTTPRYTTIFDAAVKLYVREPGDEAKIPIPTLCHQPHMTPVAVCRVCVVQIYGQKRGKRAAERKLLPACQHPVKDGMEVFTMNAPGRDGERVRQAVKVVTELLAADHLKPAPAPAPALELAAFNELGQAHARCGGDAARFQLDAFANHAPAAPRRPVDASSPVFLVDHSACILCDRCVRACDEVKGNNIIGRTGKGAGAGIGFDLNDPMAESGCVQCGECMVSCPTSAITFKPVAQVKIASGQGKSEVLTAAEITSDPLFAGVPPKFLLWQQGLAVRRRFQAGDVLCRQGDPGNSAFIIRRGRLEVSVFASAPQSGGGRSRSRGEKVLFRAERTPADVIVGEMACLSSSPRSADIVALDDGEIWEIRRNVLDRLMRLPSQRGKFERLYRERSLDVVLSSVDLFKGIETAEYGRLIEFLRPRLSFLSVGAGQTVFRQGDPADGLYLLRLGRIRVGLRRFGSESRVVSLPPGSIFGEIALLAVSPDDAGKTADEVDRAVKAVLDGAGTELLGAIPAGVRMATCTALEHVELARLNRADFLEMIRDFPTLRRRIVETSLERLRSARDLNPFMNQYVEQGLYEARSVLVLDLDLCTRCDECTKGCVQQHGVESHGVPITRLLRDGPRFGNFVVATSCRSCETPHCMTGCPVDSIHRGRHQQIVIEDHCIGCGLCATNCPYGSIFMTPDEHRPLELPKAAGHTHSLRIAQPKAATCDLCDSAGTRSSPLPRCVYSCPHEAAFRMTGSELLARVTNAS